MTTQRAGRKLLMREGMTGLLCMSWVCLLGLDPMVYASFGMWDRPVQGNAGIDRFLLFTVGIAFGLRMTGLKTVISLSCKQIIC